MLDFETVYREEFPKIVAYGRNSGLQESDCQDLAQNVLLDFYKKLSAGKVKEETHAGYIFQIVKWRLIDRQRSITSNWKTSKVVGEENDLDLLPLDNSEKSETIWQWRVIKRAAKMVKPRFTKKHFNFFVERVLNGKLTEEISQKYNTNASQVYLCKHRVMQAVIDAGKEIVRTEGYGIQPI